MILAYARRIDLGDGPMFQVGRLRLICLRHWPRLRRWANANAYGLTVGYLSIVWCRSAEFAAITAARSPAGKEGKP